MPNHQLYVSYDRLIEYLQSVRSVDQMGSMLLVQDIPSSPYFQLVQFVRV